MNLINLLHRSLIWLQDQIDITINDFLISVLKAGPTPKHVGFIMDGNRRYSRMNNKAIKQGHGDGFVALCHVSGIRTMLNAILIITIYRVSDAKNMLQS